MIIFGIYFDHLWDIYAAHDKFAGPSAQGVSDLHVRCLLLVVLMLDALNLLKLLISVGREPGIAHVNPTPTPRRWSFGYFEPTFFDSGLLQFSTVFSTPLFSALGRHLGSIGLDLGAKSDQNL